MQTMRRIEHTRLAGAELMQTSKQLVIVQSIRYLVSTQMAVV